MGTCDALDLGCWFAWLFEEIDLFFLDIYGSILDGIVVLFNMLPIPDFLLTMGSYTLPPTVSYYLAIMELKVGMSMVISAYTARFILRRLPVVG